MLFIAVIAAPVYSQRAGAAAAAGPNCKTLFSVSCCCCHEGPFIMTADLSLSAGFPVRPIPLCWRCSKSTVSHGHVPGSLHVRVQWCPEQTGCLLWQLVLCGRLRGRAEPLTPPLWAVGFYVGLHRGSEMINSFVPGIFCPWVPVLL